MDASQALAVVRSLANGVDPASGEVFPAESAYQRPDVVRALYEAASALERQERYDRRKAEMPRRLPIWAPFRFASRPPVARMHRLQHGPGRWGRFEIVPAGIVQRRNP